MGKYIQARKRAETKTGKTVLESYFRVSEHHHIVCVSAIQKMMPDPKFHDYASATTWCINEKANLIGLPMWSLHMMHYCELATANPRVRGESVRGG